MKILLWFIVLIFASPCFALSVHPKLDAEYVHPRDSENGFETGFGAYAYVTGDLELGLRGAYSHVSQNGPDRHSWLLGGQGNFWVMNVFGPGLGVSWVSTSGDATLSDNHYRIEPLFDVRVLHAGYDGALAIRVGAPYEKQLGWGLAVGVTFQYSGLSSREKPLIIDSSDQ